MCVCRKVLYTHYTHIHNVYKKIEWCWNFVHQNCAELSLGVRRTTAPDIMTENDGIASSKVNWLHGNSLSFCHFFCFLYLFFGGPMRRKYAHVSFHFVNFLHQIFRHTHTNSAIVKFCYDLASFFVTTLNGSTIRFIHCLLFTHTHARAPALTPLSIFRSEFRSVFDFLSPPLLIFRTHTHTHTRCDYHKCVQYGSVLQHFAVSSNAIYEVVNKDERALNKFPWITLTMLCYVWKSGCQVVS